MKSNATPKLSRPSKMPCKSWSLPAWESCPSAKMPNGKPVPACQYCYALTGAYRFPATIASRAHNMEDWKHDDWVSAMVAKIGKAKYFRWFDSGDVYHVDLAKKIKQVIEQTPNCQHWLPTRQHNGDMDISIELCDIERLPNAVVRYSSNSIHGAYIQHPHMRSSVIIQSADDFMPQTGHTLCRAYERDGKCGSCRACWGKKAQVVFYPLHGHKVKDKWFV